MIEMKIRVESKALHDFGLPVYINKWIWGKAQHICQLGTYRL